MTNVTIYHNPSCSKSRQTLALLEEQGIEPQVIEYLQEPPTPAQLQEILVKLKMTPRNLIRKNEAVFKEKQLDDSHLSDAQLIELMCRYPKLIQRPIVIVGKKAVLGRPPENVLRIL